MPRSTAFQSVSVRAVLLPESFRGGCSFGAGNSPDLSRTDSHAPTVTCRHANRGTIPIAARLCEADMGLSICDIEAEAFCTARRQQPQRRRPSSKPKTTLTGWPA
ncbi:MAG: hypothetical protein Tsb0019_06480 [Roseibium sp.]